MSAPTHIIETLANQFFQVREASPALDHAWLGIEVKRTKAGFVPKAKAREILVRKVGTRTVAKTAPADRLTTFFADLDKVLAVLARPDFQIDELKLRLANNDRCKSQLHRPNRNYTALDLTAIECGLAARLKDAQDRLHASQADAALTKSDTERGQRLLVIVDKIDREAA